MRRLEFEQPALAFQAPSIAPEMSRRAESEMARDHDPDRICAIGGADRANRARPPNSSRDLGIGSRFAARNRTQLLPYAPLKLGTANIERQLGHRQISAKIFRDRSRPFAGARIVAANRGFRIVAPKLGSDRAIRVAQRSETKPVTSASNEQTAKLRLHDRISDTGAAAVRPVRRF